MKAILFMISIAPANWARQSDGKVEDRGIFHCIRVFLGYNVY
jgi:hypothetical protein